MTKENYTPYGDEWKKEISKLPKSAIIQIAAEIGQKLESLKQDSELRLQCRHYLMGVNPKDLTVENALQELGYGRDGLGY